MRSNAHVMCAMRCDAMRCLLQLCCWYGMVWLVRTAYNWTRPHSTQTHTHVKCVLLTRPLSTKKNLEKFEKSRKMDKNVKIKEGTWSGRKGEEGGRHKVRLRSLIKPLKTNMKEVAQEPESTEKPKKKQIYTKEVKSALALL